MPGFDEAHVLALAALARSDGGDPVDGAIRAAAANRTVSDAPTLVKLRKKLANASGAFRSLRRGHLLPSRRTRTCRLLP
jgi:hypothetical protein